MINQWGHIGFFSGIGGFELAAEWNDIENLASCEINNFGNYILNYYFPNGYHHRDIQTLTNKILNEELTKMFGPDFRANRKIVLSGGFPCQDNSKANQSKTRKSGLQGKRTGLAFEFIRLIEEIGPIAIIAENVSDFLSVNGGQDFRTVLGELARMGYNAEWKVCRSSDVGAPHERSRVYIVAYSDSIRLQEGQSFFSYVCEKNEPISWSFAGTSIQTFRGGAWSCEPPPICVDDGFSKAMAGFSASQWRKEQIKAFGNAVTPQIPNAIFKAMKEIC